MLKKFNEVCELLSVTRDGLRKIMLKDGLSMRTIERVSAELKIKRFRPQGETGWHWKLPDFHKDVPPVLPEHKQHY